MKNSQYLIKKYLKYISLNKLNSNQLKMIKNVKTFQSIHEIIGNDENISEVIEDAPLKSISTRINNIWFKLNNENNKKFDKDSLNRTILKSIPKLNRSTIISENWIINPFIHIWKVFSNKRFKKKYKIIPSKRKVKKLKEKISIRRYILLILTICQTTIATWYMKGILPYQKFSLLNFLENSHYNIKKFILFNIPYILEVCILFLFSILFCWISAGFWTALMGFIQLINNNNNISKSLKNNIKINHKHSTAIIMPICNEDVDLAFAGLRATLDSLHRTGQNKYFDVYILSDSYDADIIISEQKSWMDLVNDLNGYGKIFYRRRKRCTKRKSGNIDDFCRRWGKNYHYMIILDADSVMSGKCLINLVKLMESNPKAGIIQSYPKAFGMNTLYARFQQFSTRVYGPIFTAGLHFWQLGESHYWGHNAIIRIKPFIKHCTLAPLPGKGAFSGSILSHDFVEAALMRRAGWNVWIAYDLPGSYEELPPNLLDELKRDRRWCYGNLMNFRLFLVKGIHPVHRAVFLTGLMSYISAPLWFIFLILSTCLQASKKIIQIPFFSKSNELFLEYTQHKSELAITLFSTTLILLFLPKILSVILIFLKGIKPYGGIKKLFLSLILEMIFSILLAPIRMLFHTIFITKALTGRKILWYSPQRNDKSTNWSFAFRKHTSQVIIGCIWVIIINFLDIKILFYLFPIICSWILSPFISVLSSRRLIGLKSKKLKLFMTPEEYDPPQELIDTENYLKINRKLTLKNGFMHALFHPTINALATSLAFSRHKNSQLVESERNRKINYFLKKNPKLFNYKEKLDIINDPIILTRMHSKLWSNLKQHKKWIMLYDNLIINPKIYLNRNNIKK